MPAIRLEGISNYALRNVNLEIKDGELFCLVGPSGAGKTTLLKVIAGLVGYRGSVYFNEKRMDNIPPEKRGVGYVPQNQLLFPHLDAASNIGYGLKMRGFSKVYIERKVEELMNMMGISHLRKRYPKSLSGGEKQRVALARALACNPEVLLLDEPFNNLDPETSNKLRFEIRHIQRKLKLTTVLVTHVLDEARDISDRVGVLIDGKLQQVSSMEELIFSPKSDEIYKFLGPFNVFKCENCRLSEGLAFCDCGGVTIVAPYEGENVTKIAISSKDVVIAKTKELIPKPHINVFKGVVEDLEAKSAVAKIIVRINNNLVVTATVSLEYLDNQKINVGDDVYLKFPLSSLRIS